jgi:hypothetical protein
MIRLSLISSGRVPTIVITFNADLISFFIVNLTLE